MDCWLKANAQQQGEIGREVGGIGDRTYQSKGAVALEQEPKENCVSYGAIFLLTFLASQPPSDRETCVPRVSDGEHQGHRYTIQAERGNCCAMVGTIHGIAVLTVPPAPTYPLCIGIVDR